MRRCVLLLRDLGFFFFWKIIEERAPRAQTAEKRPPSPRGLCGGQMAEAGNLFRFNSLLESPPCLVGEETATQRDAGGTRSREIVEHLLCASCADNLSFNLPSNLAR